MTYKPDDDIIPVVLSPEGVAKWTNGVISRTRVFELIKARELDARKCGRRTFVTATSLRAFLERQPKVG